ncbi:MAG: hypothetical protein H6551_09520 [Chitinophagales bacterium]|nr:hypothetical protein [Chitinophagaceae bacterium]MCB9065362.1 hypothetical protein [Chitinophagales bacterium]
MSKTKNTYLLFLPAALLLANLTYAQPKIDAKIDSKQIIIGDQARLFIEAKPDKNERLIWAVIPDTFDNLEVVEKGKIDTLNENGIVSYKQRLLITGWDSGMYRIPPLEFTSVPKSGAPYKVATDSFNILVQTVPVDTAQPFKPITDILQVKTTWRDYIWYIIGGLIAIGLVVFVIYYFRKNKKEVAPAYKPKAPVETPFQKALRMLEELDKKQLWQTDHVKQYYTELTDILRVYIEERFRTPAMELTSDELLLIVSRHREMARYKEGLATVLHTADMAKFAKAQPLPQEHINVFDETKQFVQKTKPVEQPTNEQA